MTAKPTPTPATPPWATAQAGAASPRWIITLEPERPLPYRHKAVARWLKVALRCHGLRCRDIRAADEPTPVPAGTPPADTGPKAPNKL